MKEYITKDRAKQFVCGHCNEVCSEEPCEPSDCDWMAFIDKEPAADVVEVRHGIWKEWWPGIAEIMTGEEMLYRCSACDAKYADIDGYKYCPYCGAKMDKEEKHEM